MTIVVEEEVIETIAETLKHIEAIRAAWKPFVESKRGNEESMLGKEVTSYLDVLIHDCCLNSYISREEYEENERESCDNYEHRTH
jgi:hypothetical protein